MDKQALLELLEQAREQKGDWREALDSAVDMVENAITVERRTGDTVEGSDNYEISVYVTGTDAEDAKNGLLWESYDAAKEAADDSSDPLDVFEVVARIDWSTIAPAD
jgi:hypothetical protein